MGNEEEYWEGEFPPETPGDDAVYVAGVYPSLKLERRALQAVSKSAKKDPLIAMKESQENLIRLCITQIGDESVNYADLRGANLERYLDPHQIYMLAELFDTWQTPEQTRVEGFLESVKMKSSTSSTRSGPKKSPTAEPRTDS